MNDARRRSKDRRRGGEWASLPSSRSSPSVRDGASASSSSRSSSRSRDASSSDSAVSVFVPVLFSVQRSPSAASPSASSRSSTSSVMSSARASAARKSAKSDASLLDASSPPPAAALRSPPLSRSAASICLDRLSHSILSAARRASWRRRRACRRRATLCFEPSVVVDESSSSPSSQPPVPPSSPKSGLPCANTPPLACAAWYCRSASAVSAAVCEWSPGVGAPPGIMLGGARPGGRGGWCGECGCGDPPGEGLIPPCCCCCAYMRSWSSRYIAS